MQVPVIQKVKQTGMYAIVADYADTAPVLLMQIKNIW